MKHFTLKSISAFHSPSRYWGRYVDVTMVIMKRDMVAIFFQHLTSIHSSIKFTVEHESINFIAMLGGDLISRHEDGSLSFSVYRKSTHTDQYLNFSSHQFSSLTHRTKTLSSDADNLNKGMDHVKRSLSICGYTKWAWSSPSSKKQDPNPLRRAEQPL